MVTDYNIIGLISALSILKNGPLLRFLNAQIREQMFGSTTDSSNILPLKNGSDKIRLVDLFTAIQILVFLFQSSKSSILTRKKFICLLLTKFLPMAVTKESLRKKCTSFWWNNWWRGRRKSPMHYLRKYTTTCHVLWQRTNSEFCIEFHNFHNCADF